MKQQMHGLKDLISQNNKVGNLTRIPSTPPTSFSSKEKYSVGNLYLAQMIYMSNYSKKSCWVARCFKISNKSVQYRKLSYARLFLLSRRTTEDSISAETRAILCLPVHIFIESKEFISHRDTTNIESDPHVGLLL